MNNLIKFTIDNKNYGKIRDIDLYITEKLKAELEKIGSRNYGNQFNKLKTVGLKGLKHLLETIKKSLKGNVKIIFSTERSKIQDNNVIIDYESYRKLGNREFFEVYRKTGLNTANKFLQEKLKGIEGISPADLISKKETELIIENLKPSFDKIPTKSKDLLFFSLASMIRESKIDTSKLNIDSLKNIKAATAQAYFKNKIDEFNKRLKKKYPETRGKNSWQTWIYGNVWLFGMNYVKSIEKQKVGFDNIPDFVFLTVDQFLDVLDIKAPEHPVIIKDKNHSGSYYWSSKVSEAIGQVANYLHELEKNQLQVAQRIERELNLKIRAVKPRAMIVIGRSNKWDENENEGFRKLNDSLHGIEVIAYDQLLMRANRLVEIYEQEYKSKSIS